MASPRATISLLKSLSPQKIQNSYNLRQALSPKLSSKTTLTPEKALENHLTVKDSPIFKIDTPYKKKLINKGFLNQHHTVLGNGAFGTVYKAYYKDTEVAAKIIKNNKRSSDSVKMEKEVAFLRHSNIVRILKVDEGPALTLITMELCGKSLQDILEESPISKQQKICFWKAIANALIYCHKMGVVHADVKPKNILMGSNSQPKLADFGSAVFTSEHKTSFFHGTPGYAAPEVVCNCVPTPLSDIYSLGILAWQMLSRKPPFSGLHKHTVLYLTGKGITPSDSHLNDGFEGKYKELYKTSWKRIPEDRIDLASIIKVLIKLETKIIEVL